MKQIFFSTGALLALTNFAHAATYIVDNQNPHAADTNPGTREAPLKTIRAAAQKTQPGDEVLVRPGTYRESVGIRNSGAEGKPIVFRSEVPRAAVLSGSDVITEWRVEGPGTWSMSDPRLTKIEQSENYMGNGQWIYVNGYPLQRADSREQMAPGGFWHDIENKRVWVMPEEGQDIKNLKVEYAHRDGLFAPDGAVDDIHIVGFTLVQNHSPNGFRGRSSIGASGRRWLIENNHVRWASYMGISASHANGTIVRNNLVEWCGDAAMGGARSINLVFEGNKLLYSDWRRINPNFEGGASKWSQTYNTRIRNNEVAYNYGYGLWTDGWDSGVIFEGNVCHDNLMGASLFTEIDYGNIFRDNVTYNNENGITIGESPNTLVMRNIVFNNNSGIRMRGNHRRGNEHAASPSPAEAHENRVRNLKRIPGITDMESEQEMARYLLFWRAPKYHMSNNSYLEENIVFDNSTNYFEHRNYAERSDIDPFINNFSNYNIWWHSDPERNFQHAAGRYADFATWQKVSGRDEKSVYVNPRDSKTKLPEWAEAKRHYWAKKYRTPTEMAALKLGIIESPMTAELLARIRRANNVRALPISDSQIKAFAFDVEGQPVVAVWTSQTADRRYVRLDADANSVVVENGYGGQSTRTLPNGAIEVVATYVPTYIRGVGKDVRELPGSTISARSYNSPNQPVPVKAVFINDSKTTQTLRANFSATSGYRVNPPQISQQVKPGERAEIALSAVPQAPFVGSARVVLDAELGNEKIMRSATFAVGEGGARLVTAPRAPIIDGKLDDWQALGDSAVLGSIASDEQITRGARNLWNGTGDASAKMYSVWTKDAIYAAVAVNDDQIVPVPAGVDPYHSDAVEFFLDGRASDMQWQVPHTEGVYQIAAGQNQAGQAEVKVLAKSTLQGLETAWDRTANGYIVEMKIPLTAQNFPARDWNVGRTVKMSVLLNDKDDAATDGPENVFGWSFSPNGRNFADTSGWRTLVLE
jgi:hypothetical protein